MLNNVLHVYSGLIIDISSPHDTMTLDEKIRLGMVALTGASLVFASLGLHLGPLDIIGGAASG